MPDVLVVEGPKLTQSKDAQVWQIGANPVVFEEPFADANYVFDADAQDSGITWDPNAKTPTGIVITASAATSRGFYSATGNSAEFRATELATIGIGANGKVNRGAKALTLGINTITFPTATQFTDTDYEFIPIGKDVEVHEVAGSKQVGQIQVFASDDCPNFEYVAIGK